MNAKYVYPNPEGSREPVTIEEMAGLNTLTPLEADMRSSGFVRCPNVFNRWYAGHAGMLEPVVPLELRVTDAIWLVTRAYGQTSDIIPLMRFDSAQSLGQYLKDNHRIAQALPPLAILGISVASMNTTQSTALIWSREFPKIPGLYWVRYHGQKHDIVKLTGKPGHLTQMFYGERRLFRNLPKDWAWEWAGPIPEPQEPLSNA